MKAKNILLTIAAFVLVPSLLLSCWQDRWAEYEPLTRTDTWIDDTMRVHYYWYEDMPGFNDLNYFIEPFEFYASLLSPHDGKNGIPYSTIDSLYPNTRSIPYTDYSYGFQFAVARVEDNDTALYAHILYVTPSSPASEAGLQRGDWILGLDEQPITEKNVARLYGSSAVNLTVGYYDAPNDTILAYDGTRQMPSARTIDDNPVHYTNIYEKGGKRVGYLVYNHFSRGVADASGEYDAALCEAFRNFASAGVNEFVLDLRYNNGGLVSCAQLLCAMLAPADALGEVLGYLEFNKRTQPQQQFIMMDNSLIQNGANLNLQTLYVLTSDQTASASEMVINCLKPYMNVILIGETTEGKNVGSTTFNNEELMISIQPIVCKIYNANGESDYENGFTPDYPMNEDRDYARFLPFGNPDELLLGTALSLIDGTYQPETSVRQNRQITRLTNSVARRADNAVRLK